MLHPGHLTSLTLVLALLCRKPTDLGDGGGGDGRVSKEGARKTPQTGQGQLLSAVGRQGGDRTWERKPREGEPQSRKQGSREPQLYLEQ